MIDLTTLAAAKAYTDKKCENAGGGGLPVVEITTPINLMGDDGNISSDISIDLSADSTALTKALENGAPIIITFTTDFMGVISCVANCVHGLGLLANVGNMAFTFTNMTGSWTFSFET